MQENIKILQFGEGNFLRAFADDIVCRLRKKGLFGGSIRVFNLRKSGSVSKLVDNGCKYHLVLRGIDPERGAVSETSVVDSISDAVNCYEQYEKFIESALLPDLRFVISNSTEAGIYFDASDKFSDTPPTSFPAKLTQLLFKRFKHFGGDENKGLVLLPCELLERNGDELKSCVLKYAQSWELERGFSEWLESACVFCNTLVDRIVSGHPAADDKFITDPAILSDPISVVGEPYLFWAIESPQDFSGELPLDKCGLNVIFTDDIAPYRARKVALLNAPHTLAAAIGMLGGIETVREAVEHPVLGGYIQKLMFSELAESLSAPRAQSEAYAREILDRFRNPYLEHKLSSIANNAIAKCKVRVIPQLAKYREKTGGFAPLMMYGLAANAQMAFKNPQYLPALPEVENIAEETDCAAFAEKLAKCPFFAGEFAGDGGFKHALLDALAIIERDGALGGIENFLK